MSRYEECVRHHGRTCTCGIAKDTDADSGSKQRTPLDDLIWYIRRKAESRRIAILSVKEARMLIAAWDGALESDSDDPDEALWPPRRNQK